MAGGWAPLGSVKASFMPGTLFRRSGCIPGVTETTADAHRLWRENTDCVRAL